MFITGAKDVLRDARYAFNGVSKLSGNTKVPWLQPFPWNALSPNRLPVSSEKDDSARRNELLQRYAKQEVNVSVYLDLGGYDAALRVYDLLQPRVNQVLLRNCSPIRSLVSKLAVTSPR